MAKLFSMVAEKQGALARVMVSMEGRRNALKSFCQGFPGTVHTVFLEGRDPHHDWECAILARGESLHQALAANPLRQEANNPYYAGEGIADPALG